MTIRPAELLVTSYLQVVPRHVWEKRNFLTRLWDTMCGISVNTDDVVKNIQVKVHEFCANDQNRGRLPIVQKNLKKYWSILVHQATTPEQTFLVRKVQSETMQKVKELILPGGGR